MPQPSRFSQLSPARQALVRVCQALNFGEIQGVLVRDGEPVFGESAPIVVIDVKLDKREEPRPQLALTDFELREEVRHLMARLDEVKNGAILRVEVRVGIPRRVVFALPLPDALPLSDNPPRPNSTTGS